MTLVYLILFCIACWVFVKCLFSAPDGKNNTPKTPPASPKRKIRCPTCGAWAEVRGSQWECGFCGDCGRITYSSGKK